VDMGASDNVSGGGKVYDIRRRNAGLQTTIPGQCVNRSLKS